jgi:hypothetical protein
MSPIQLFVQGNVIVMLLISLAGAGVIFYAVRLWRNSAEAGARRALILTGAASIMIGMLGQSIGLIQVLNVLSRAGEVPADLITGGIANTFIPMVYGALWFLVALAVGYIKS